MTLERVTESGGGVVRGYGQDEDAGAELGTRKRGEPRHDLQMPVRAGVEPGVPGDGPLDRAERLDEHGEQVEGRVQAGPNASASCPTGASSIS